MSAWRIWWRANGAWGWVCAVLVLLALSLTLLIQPVPLGWVEHGERVLAEGAVVLETRGRIRPGRSFEARLTGAPTATGTLRLLGTEEAASVAGADALELAVPDELHRIVLRFEHEAGTVEWPLGAPLR